MAQSALIVVVVALIVFLLSELWKIRDLPQFGFPGAIESQEKVIEILTENAYKILLRFPQSSNNFLPALQQRKPFITTTTKRMTDNDDRYCLHSV